MYPMLVSPKYHDSAFKIGQDRLLPESLPAHNASVGAIATAGRAASAPWKPAVTDRVAF
jgi:hypothetical protein